MAEYVREGRYTEARKAYFECMQMRPDVALAVSDLNDEIHAIEVILYILEN